MTHRVAAVVRRALATYRAEWRRVFGAAMLVLLPISLVATAAEAVVVGIPAATWSDSVIEVVLVLVVVAAGRTLGSVFYAGLLDRLVGHRQRGHPRMSLGEVVRTLPYRRLWIANVVLVLATTIGLLLFALPGVLVYTLFALVGPIINIENRPVLEGFRRSIELVLPNFLLVFVLATLPAAAEQVVHQLVHFLLEHQPGYVRAIVLDGLLAGTVGAFLGLVEVTLTYELGARGRHLQQAAR
jgi:hypothetical protein